MLFSFLGSKSHVQAYCFHFSQPQRCLPFGCFIPVEIICFSLPQRHLPFGCFIPLEIISATDFVFPNLRTIQCHFSCLSSKSASGIDGNRRTFSYVLCLVCRRENSSPAADQNWITPAWEELSQTLVGRPRTWRPFS